MNDEQRDLARRLAAHPRFEWRDGMMVLCDGDVSGRVPSGGFKGPLMGADHHPDLTDAATGGVLLDMLKGIACGIEIGFWAAMSGVTVTHWDHGSGRFESEGTTLAEACARALLAEWGEP